MSALSIPYRAAPVWVVAGTVAAAAQSRFETRVNLVALDLCVTDRHGRTASIDADDVVVLDNGVRQPITFFSPGERVPLAVTLLVDSSVSMDRLLPRATAAAAALIARLPCDTLVQVISFNDQISIRYPLGADHREATRSLQTMTPAGGTALYEALSIAIRNHERVRPHRAALYRDVIVLITDGEDNAGHVSFDRLLEEARRSGVLVYPIMLPAEDAHGAGAPWQMAQLASDTGGETITARRPDDLVAMYERIATDVRALYRIGFEPSPHAVDGAWHRLQVRVLSTDLVVRTRSGYFAPAVRV